MKITRFESFIEKAIPWFVAVAFLVILWAATSCTPYPLQKQVIKPRSEAKASFR